MMKLILQVVVIRNIYLCTIDLSPPWLISAGSDKMGILILCAPSAHLWPLCRYLCRPGRISWAYLLTFGLCDGTHAGQAGLAAWGVKSGLLDR